MSLSKELMAKEGKTLRKGGFKTRMENTTRNVNKWFRIRAL